MLYDVISDSVLKTFKLDDDDGVPDEVFERVSPKGVHAYFISGRDGKPFWGHWNAASKSWVKPDAIPETVQLWRMLL